MMTSTHMVSYHKTSKENGSSEDEENVFDAKSGKTKE